MTAFQRFAIEAAHAALASCRDIPLAMRAALGMPSASEHAAKMFASIDCRKSHRLGADIIHLNYELQSVCYRFAR